MYPERITLQLEDGKTFKVPLEEMEVVGEGKASESHKPRGV